MRKVETMKRFFTFLVILIVLSCGLNIAFAQEVSIRRLENAPEVSHVGQVLKYRIDIDDAASLTKANLTWSAPDELIDIKTIETTNLFTAKLSNRTFNAADLAPGWVSYVAGWLTFRAISAGSGNLRVTGTLTTIQGTVKVDTQLPIIVRSPDPSHLLPARGDFEFTRKVSADSPGWNSVGVPSMIGLGLYNAVNIAEYEVELTYDVNLLGVMRVNTSPGTTIVGASAGRITLRGSWTTP